MSRKKQTEDSAAPAEAPPEPNGNGNGHSNGNGNGNGQVPRRVVKKFTAQSGKDTSIVVEVVENEFQTQTGERVTYLCAVCSRPYVKPDGQVGTSYSYRQYDVPVLLHLLQKAHGFILDHRVIVDDPV